MATSNDEGRRPAVEYGDQRVERGHGGETHQIATDGAPRLTTQQGVVVSDDQNTLRSGIQGPSALEDFYFREKIFHFDHERIPERVVHARGYGAHGYFENYEPLTDLTRADPFPEAGLRTPVFVRFSTVAGNKGSADLARDVRGFATKFYTREGNWDLVGNNIPVFFIQDAIKFPDLIHTAKQEPDRGFPQAQTAHDNFWDFVSLMPESTHMLLWTMSDRAIPRSLRFMEGFGVHTFRLVNAEGRSTFVTFHWKPKLGLQSVVWNEAVKINGADPDFHRRDLWDAITQGDFPEWELGLQLFDDDFADRFAFDILDPTKIIPEEEVPVRRVGRLVLDREVDNFFAETEQVAFVIGCPLASRSLMERAPAGFPPAVPRRRMAIWKAHRPGKATRAPGTELNPDLPSGPSITLTALGRAAASRFNERRERLPVQPVGLPAASLGRVLAFGELLDNLRAERGQVVGSAAGHQALVGDDLLVDPGAAGVADVGGQGRPRGQGAAADHVGFDQRPRSVADHPGRLAGLEEAADEAHRIAVSAELVRADRAAGHQQGVVVVG